jgi:Protein of unknown function DUF262
MRPEATAMVMSSQGSDRHRSVVPVYQREFSWEHERRSRFIESLLMGLPVPFLFFWESPETGKLEVVDGSQRLRSIEEIWRSETRRNCRVSLFHIG